MKKKAVTARPRETRRKASSGYHASGTGLVTGLASEACKNCSTDSPMKPETKTMKKKIKSRWSVVDPKLESKIEKQASNSLITIFFFVVDRSEGLNPRGPSKKTRLAMETGMAFGLFTSSRWFRSDEKRTLPPSVCTLLVTHHEALFLIYHDIHNNVAYYIQQLTVFLPRWLICTENGSCELGYRN